MWDVNIWVENLRKHKTNYKKSKIFSCDLSVEIVFAFISQLLSLESFTISVVKYLWIVHIQFIWKTLKLDLILVGGWCWFDRFYLVRGSVVLFDRGCIHGFFVFAGSMVVFPIVFTVTVMCISPTNLFKIAKLNLCQFGFNTTYMRIECSWKIAIIDVT